ncbi:MAG TPA: hypothetical protein PLK85_03245 [Alphaproteobacteria bacterium]|nr:hypothetical protein [Alphaproteobacteria bacterium]
MVAENVVAGKAGENLGKAFAKAGFTDQQRGLVDSMSGLHEQSKIDAIGNAIVRGIFNRVFPGLGSLMTAAEAANNYHKAGIELMEKEGVPGFEKHEVILDNGDHATIWVDASAVASGGRPKTYVEGGPDKNKDELTYFEKKALKQLEQEEKRIAREAQADVKEAGKGYNDKLEKAIESIPDKYGQKQTASLQINGDFSGTDVAAAGSSSLLTESINAGVDIAENAIATFERPSPGVSSPAVQSFNV